MTWKLIEREGLRDVEIIFSVFIRTAVRAQIALCLQHSESIVLTVLPTKY